MRILFAFMESFRLVLWLLRVRGHALVTGFVNLGIANIGGRHFFVFLGVVCENDSVNNLGFRDFCCGMMRKERDD